MPTLSNEVAKQYEALVKLQILKVPLSNSRNMDWLFALWGSSNKIDTRLNHFSHFFVCIVHQAYCVASAMLDDI